MPNKRFTLEQIIALQGNPYTQRVTNDTIEFTQVSCLMYVRLRTRHATPEDILLTLGYNPEFIGKERMIAMDQRLRGSLEYILSPEDKEF